MLRNNIIRSARVASRSVVRQPLAATLNSIRLNSTQTPTPTPFKRPKTAAEIARRAALEEKNDLQRDWDAKVITYEDFVEKTENPSNDTYIIDVREKEEVMQGMIPASVNIPLTVLPEALHMDHKQFAEKFGFEKPLVSQEVIFYCRSGVRSTSACDIAKRNRYTNILNYKGSWLEWTNKLNEKAATACHQRLESLY